MALQRKLVSNTPFKTYEERGDDVYRFDGFPGFMIKVLPGKVAICFVNLARCRNSFFLFGSDQCKDCPKFPKLQGVRAKVEQLLKEDTRRREEERRAAIRREMENNRQKMQER